MSADQVEAHVAAHASVEHLVCSDIDAFTARRTAARLTEQENPR